MNGRCETCSAEKVCAYQYKPTECANQRKFVMSPDAVDCPNCNGSGYAYPWKCKPCNGTGLVLRHNDLANRRTAASSPVVQRNEVERG